MAKIKFTLGATVWIASCGRTYPVGDSVKVNVPTDLTDGGQMYAYDKGIVEQFFPLVFTSLEDDADTLLRDFHQNHAVGPKNTFTYTDKYGVDHTVRWLDTRYPLSKRKHNRNAGTIQLRKEI